MVNFQKTYGTHLIVLLIPKRARSRDSSVGIATGYGLDGRGSISAQGKEMSIFSTGSRSALGPTQPLTMGTGSSIPGCKAAGA
jgi:hypothetical protein